MANRRYRKSKRRDAEDHLLLERLYNVIDSRKRDPMQIAKKLGEEAVETLIEGIRGDRFKLVLESADLLYQLVALWAANGVKPAAVWSELARRVDVRSKP
jgi:phosphoribosyl-ATP pyrophosphohydrolase